MVETLTDTKGGGNGGRDIASTTTGQPEFGDGRSSRAVFNQMVTANGLDQIPGYGGHDQIPNVAGKAALGSVVQSLFPNTPAEPLYLFINPRPIPTDANQWSGFP